MTVSGLFSALLVGLVIGALARLVLPGKQAIGIILTIVVGIVAALLGTRLSNAVGVGDAQGYDVFEFLFQLGLAVLGVGATAAIMRQSKTKV